MLPRKGESQQDLQLKGTPHAVLIQKGEKSFTPITKAYEACSNVRSVCTLFSQRMTKA